jgi:hypothetical protein
MEQKYSYVVFLSFSAVVLYYFYKRRNNENDSYNNKRRKITIDLIPNIYYVNSYKNLDLWYNNTDYQLFKIDYFKNTNENNLKYNEILGIHPKTLFF